MMHVEILRNVMINGEPYTPGSLVELSVADTNLLVGAGKAKVVPTPVAAPEPEPQPEPEPEPAPSPRGRRSKTTSPQE